MHSLPLPWKHFPNTQLCLQDPYLKLIYRAFGIQYQDLFLFYTEGGLVSWWSQWSVKMSTRVPFLAHGMSFKAMRPGASPKRFWQFGRIDIPQTLDLSRRKFALCGTALRDMNLKALPKRGNIFSIHKNCLINHDTERSSIAKKFLQYPF